jgi:hypothetical protein
MVLAYQKCNFIPFKRFGPTVDTLKQFTQSFCKLDHFINANYLAVSRKWSSLQHGVITYPFF